MGSKVGKQHGESTSHDSPPPSYLYEVSSARAPEGFHSVKEEPQRKDFQVDFPFENPTGYKKPTARYQVRGLINFW